MTDLFKINYIDESRITFFYIRRDSNIIRVQSLCVCLCFLIILLSRCSNTNKSLKILFAGDLMLDRGTKSTIERSNPAFLFENVNHLLSSTDFSIANLECVFCDTSLRPLDKKFVFRANPQWLSTIHDNGITHVTVANNHSFDFGDEGIHQTISNLKKFEIHPIGYNAENTAACLPTNIEKYGIHLAVFSSCFLQQNNTQTCNETASILSENIREFKKAHPDYFVIVCLHWGVELRTTPTVEQIEEAHLIINSGADAIIGHHPHVVQTIEIFKGKYIFYSIGNFIFDNNHPPSNSGIFSIFSLSKNGIAPVEIIPYTIVHSKPILMSKEESKLFMKEIGSVSKNIKLKQYDSLWELF
jgi:poly-gamma-glutamate capsule biosynthesis protein CapA/YwtB (metallophosphatase superfamily)